MTPDTDLRSTYEGTLHAMENTSTDRKNGEDRPRVTVLMPAYNVERYIAEAIDSVLAQTFTNFELLVIDDASSDTTPAVIETFAGDARLRVVRQNENLGRPGTRNHGLDIASGDYIAFLDADDCCAPQRLATQVAYLDAHPDIGGVGSWKAWIDTDGKPVAGEIRRFPLDTDAIACEMLGDCTLGQTSLMLRRTALTGYRYDTAFPYSEDYELWARMIATVRFANLAETLTYYRRHAEQSISAHNQDQVVATLAIYGQQVDSLGVKHHREDLTRHERLLKFSSRESVLERTGAPLDIHYVRWAKRWLEALRQGNAHARIYPEPAFSYMLSARWLFAARKAVRNSGLLPVVRELASTRLTGLAIAHPVQLFSNRRSMRKS